MRKLLDQMNSAKSQSTQLTQKSVVCASKDTTHSEKATHRMGITCKLYIWWDTIFLRIYEELLTTDF